MSKPDAVIAAGFCYAVVTAHNGCLHLEVEVRGRQAHAGFHQEAHAAITAGAAGDTIDLFVRGTDQAGTGKLLLIRHDPTNGWSWQTIPALNGVSLTGDPTAFRDAWASVKLPEIRSNSWRPMLPFWKRLDARW